jgi:alpha-methylacyl-CoA racemase
MDISRFPELEEKMQTVFLQKTRDEWVEIFKDSSSCFAPVLTFEEAQQEPHIKERGIYIEVEGIKQAAPAPRFSRTQAETPKRPCMAGENTQAVLADVLGLSSEEADALIEQGVVEQA